MILLQSRWICICHCETSNIGGFDFALCKNKVPLFFFDEYKEAEKSIKGLLEKGITSPGWYLDDVLAVAKELGHPDDDKLCEFEKKITAV